MEFYGDVLGFEIAAHSAEEEGAGESGEVRLKVGKGTEIEIVLYQPGCWGGKGKEKLPDLERMRPQYSLAVSTKELLGLWEGWLRGQGVDVTSTRGQEEESCSLLFRDPDGNVGKIVWRGDGTQE